MINKNIFKKVIIGVVATLLVATVTVGMLNKNNVIKSKAANSVITQNDVYSNDEDYKNFIEKYRKDGVEVTITTLEDLYKEFNMYESVDKTLREDILAKTSDKVIIQFLLEETHEMFRLGSEVEADNIYSEITEEAIVNSDIKNIDINYYEKGNDSHKKVTKITNKFGGTIEIISADEKEENLTRGGYRHVRTLKNEQTYKEYGDRNFSATYKGPLFSSTVKFHYTLKYGRIDARKITKEEFSILPGLVKYNEYKRDIKKSTSTRIGDKITAYIEYRPAVLGPIAGGLNVGTMKIEMNVIQGPDANHPSIAKMSITQNAEVYEKVFS